LSTAEIQQEVGKTSTSCVPSAQSLVSGCI